MILVRLFLASLAILLLVLSGFLFRSPISSFWNSISLWPNMIALFLLGDPSTLLNYEGRTNILLLGVGGAGHEAPELTDTMIFVSLDEKLKNPVFLSLPRDIWVASMRAKLNTAYYYGKQKREDGGLILAKSSVEEILDQPVHYGVAVDFGAFVSLVDVLGGLETEVERQFDDYRYPIPGRENDKCEGDVTFLCRWEHIYFDQGKQIMDGQTALKFVRSRNAEGEEGTDFARSTRQQKVISAIKQKLTSPAFFLNPPKIAKAFSLVRDSIDTDIPQESLPIVARTIISLKRETIKNVVLDGGAPGDAQTGFLANPQISVKYDYQWVLVPKDETWEEVRGWISNLLF